MTVMPLDSSRNMFGEVIEENQGLYPHSNPGQLSIDTIVWLSDRARHKDNFVEVCQLLLSANASPFRYKTRGMNASLLSLAHYDSDKITADQPAEEMASGLQNAEHESGFTGFTVSAGDSMELSSAVTADSVEPIRAAEVAVDEKLAMTNAATDIGG